MRKDKSSARHTIYPTLRKAHLCLERDPIASNLHAHADIAACCASASPGWRRNRLITAVL